LHLMKLMGLWGLLLHGSKSILEINDKLKIRKWVVRENILSSLWTTIYHLGEPRIFVWVGNLSKFCLPCIIVCKEAHLVTYGGIEKLLGLPKYT